MRGPSLCCCCCCAVLTLWGVCVCVCVWRGGFDSERQAKEHQYHSGILQWESPHSKYSSVGEITAKLWQFQWFIYSRVQPVRELKGCMCVLECVCVDALSYFCGAGHESKLHENINTFDQKICSDLFSLRGFKGIFMGPLCACGKW